MQIAQFLEDLAKAIWIDCEKRAAGGTAGIVFTFGCKFAIL